MHTGKWLNLQCRYFYKLEGSVTNADHKFFMLFLVMIHYKWNYLWCSAPDIITKQEPLLNWCHHSSCFTSLRLSSPAKFTQHHNVTTLMQKQNKKISCIHSLVLLKVEIYVYAPKFKIKLYRWLKWMLVQHERWSSFVSSETSWT